MDEPQKIKVAGNGWSKDATPEQIAHQLATAKAAGLELTPDEERFVEKLATQQGGYWGGVVPPAKDVLIIDEAHDRRVEELAEEYVDTAKAAAGEEQIEVKYQPNRAERRARERQLKRSVRRGQRAYDRKIAEMEKSMSPEQIERARELARKAIGNG